MSGMKVYLTIFSWEGIDYTGPHIVATVEWIPP